MFFRKQVLQPQTLHLGPRPPSVSLCGSKMGATLPLVDAGNPHEPVLQPVEGDETCFAVVRDYWPQVPEVLEGRLEIVVRAGGDPFFNGASIPWWAHWFMQPMEPRVVAAALAHDMLYQTGGVYADSKGKQWRVSRQFADLWFCYLLHEHGVDLFRTLMAFATVATFGGCHFRDPSGDPWFDSPEPADPRLEADLRSSVATHLDTHPRVLELMLVVVSALSGCSAFLALLCASPSGWWFGFGFFFLVAVVLLTLVVALLWHVVPLAQSTGES